MLRLLSAAVVAASLACPSAQAATFFWDGNPIKTTGQAGAISAYYHIPTQATPFDPDHRIYINVVGYHELKYELSFNIGDEPAHGGPFTSSVVFFDDGTVDRSVSPINLILPAGTNEFFIMLSSQQTDNCCNWRGFRDGVVVTVDDNILAPVPLPPAFVLFASALGLIGFAVRRRTRPQDIVVAD